MSRFGDCAHCHAPINPDHFPMPLDAAQSTGRFCAECEVLPACNWCGDPIDGEPITSFVFNAPPRVLTVCSRECSDAAWLPDNQALRDKADAAQVARAKAREAAHQARIRPGHEMSPREAADALSRVFGERITALGQIERIEELVTK